jgi:hypothetical protein
VAIDYNQNIGGVDLKTTATLVLAGEREWQNGMCSFSKGPWTPQFWNPSLFTKKASGKNTEQLPYTV